MNVFTGIDEQTTPRYIGILRSERPATDPAAVVPGSVLTSLSVTMYEEQSGVIVNGRDHHDLLSDPRAAVDEQGVFEWLLETGDTAIVNPNTGRRERHIAVFELTWTVAEVVNAVQVFRDHTARHQVAFVINNLSRVA